MVQQPVSVLPHLRPFAPHIFPQSSQTLAVNLPIDSPTRWYKLHMRNSSNVQKMISIYLMLLRTWRAFFGRGKDRVLHCVDMLLYFQVIIIHLWFITSYTPGQEVRIMSNCFLQLGAHLNPMVSLVTVQETRNKICCNCLMFSSNARMRWHYPYDSPSLLQTSWIDCLLR